MLSKLFLMRKGFITFTEELLLQNRSVTNAEQVLSHEQLIISYARATTLLLKVTDQLLMSNNLLSFLFAVIFSNVFVKRKIFHKRNMSENRQENVLIWRMNVDHHMFPLRNNVTDSMIIKIIWFF